MCYLLVLYGILVFQTVQMLVSGDLLRFYSARVEECIQKNQPSGSRAAVAGACLDRRLVGRRQGV